MSEIDVSKCEFYCEKYDGCYCFNSSKEVYAVNPNEHNSCEANKDCYYKQLQQLKAENEELKKEVDKLYEQWNFSVKHKIVLEVDCRKAQEKADKYKQCIDEINEVCQVNAINTCWTALNRCDNCEEKEECGMQSPFVKLDIIRNIIKQAKEDRE